MVTPPEDRIGACGDNCSYCLRFMATVDGDRELLLRTREIWIGCGWRTPDVSLRELECGGCRPGNACAYPVLRDCAFGRRLDTCGMCPDYPCDHTREAFAREAGVRHSIGKCCRTIDRELLTRAFACKKENLDGINARRSRPEPA